jgi:UDP-N-acetylmuramate dehydrogenase
MARAHRRLTPVTRAGNLRRMGLRTPGIGERLRAAIGEGLREQEPLKHHTSFRIGGPADWFVAARTPEQLVAALRVAHELALPCFLLGGGSNLLVSDEGFRGLVVRNAIDDVVFDGTFARVGCGADYLTFIQRTPREGLAGFAYAAGIPGSVGGAIYGNAGCYGHDIGARVVECTVCSLDGTRVETRPAAWFEFGYRDSRLKREPLALLSCVLRLERGDAAAITAEIDEKLEIRRTKHPQWRIEPTAGSYFKNLPPGFQAPGLPHSPGTHRVPAGALLDLCECRGLRVGDAAVFAKHANILVNAGHATATDMLTLAEVMKARVRRRFGVELEEEVMFLGERPDVAAAAAAIP